MRLFGIYIGNEKQTKVKEKKKVQMYENLRITTGHFETAQTSILFIDAPQIFACFNFVLSVVSIRISLILTTIPINLRALWPFQLTAHRLKELLI